jgi:acyl-CoA reductase-like NAD-dependent aldehyde dehydrogenase
MTAVEPKADQATITVRNPADGRIAGTVPVDSPETVAAKARELRLFQTEWETMGPQGRKRWMLKWQDWILDNADHLTEVLMSETGKSHGDAKLEPVALADSIKYWAGNAEEFLADRHPKAHSLLFKVKKLTTVYRPYPLVGIIEPWNFPLAMLALDVVPALAAGAAVLLKPSEVTPLSAVEFVRGWTEVGAPPILGLATGYGDTGAAVIDNADYVHFTGSTATGRKVAVACAQQLKPFSLELGGKDPAIVLADADIDRAANGIAWGGMFNSGQVCISVQRVLVADEVYDPFVERLTPLVEEIRTGHPLAEGTTMGPVISEGEARRVENAIRDAVEGGATLIAGGEREGAVVAPSVLGDVDPAMDISRVELFGPAVALTRVTGIDQAIALANDSDYGLGAGLFTSDLGSALRFAREVDCGSIQINSSPLWRADLMPYGGLKGSGIGKEGPRAAVDEMTELKTVVFHPS